MDSNIFSWLWTGGGVLKERRELRTKKDNSVFKRLFKVAGLGDTFEVEVTPEVFAKYAEGETLVCRGRFAFYNGQAQFVAQEVRSSTEAPKNNAKAA